MAQFATNLLNSVWRQVRDVMTPDVASIQLQALNNVSRAYETYRTITDGWMIEERSFEERRIAVLKVTEDAVTDGLTSVITRDEIMVNLAAVVIGNDRFEARNPTPPYREPKHYRIDLEWLGLVS